MFKKLYKKLMSNLIPFVEKVLFFVKKQSITNASPEYPINNYIDSALNINQLSKDDRLNILNFSRKIANNINNLSSKNHGIVIAVYGEWGTGKTTAKNALISELTNSNMNSKNRQRILFEFDPWQVSPNENLTQRFLTDLHIITDTRNKIKKIFIDKIKPLCISTYKEPVLKLFSFILYSILLIIAYKYFISDFIIFKGENIPLLKQGCNLILLIPILMLPAILLFISDKFLSTKPWTTLKETREYFVEKFKNKEVIVIMDDIDRLPKNEIQNVMRLIKSVADFPNMIYILFCQKDIVQNAVKELHDIDNKSYPNNYLEKIIQIPYYMPKLPWGTLKNFLLNDIFSEKIFSNDLDIKITSALKERFGKFTSIVLVQHIKTIRDIKRYVSTLISNIEIFKDKNNKLIVNLEDLIYFTGLQLFLPEVLEEIYLNKENLLSTNTDEYGQHTYKNYLTSLYNGKKQGSHLQKFLFFYHNIGTSIVNGRIDLAVALLYSSNTQDNRLFTQQSFDLYFRYFNEKK
ncbi:MAG: P-loop NTPase fold protein [Endomicrobiaceae bacterium]|nr:P-loop NTPase fold protein [Endomicrobiaceae bacterium]